MRPGTRSLIAGAVLLVGFVVLHLAGGRAEVGFLSGTLPSSSASATLGLCYAASWFAAVLLAPVLIISGAVTRWLTPAPTMAPLNCA